MNDSEGRDQCGVSAEPQGGDGSWEVRDIVEDLISGAFNFLGCLHPFPSCELIVLATGWVL